MWRGDDLSCGPIPSHPTAIGIAAPPKTANWSSHVEQGTMIWGSEPEIIFSTHFMGSVTEWSHLDQMGNFRGWCYTPRQWLACDRILIHSANNIISFFAHWVYWYTSVHAPRKDPTAQFGSILGPYFAKHWTEMERRAGRDLELT